jgi:glycosyltransferase involved in cell wall biosynthesis
MKVLFANKFFFLNGGSETVFFQERDFLLKQGHEVVDFSMMDERNQPSAYADFFVPNTSYNSGGGIVPKLQQAISFIHSSVAVNKIEELVLQEKPQIAHLHNIYHQLTPSIIPVLKKHGVKIVLTLHDCKLVCPSYLALDLRNNVICNACAGGKFWKAFTLNCQNSRMRGLLLATEAMFHKWKGSYDGVDLFLTPSRFLADLTKQRIPQEKIKVLHNGIDQNIYQPQYGDQGYGLYFGRLSKEKGIQTLLRAHRNLNFLLKIAGTGPLEEKLRKEYPEVEFLGYQSGQNLNNLIANAAFVVVPSEWYENCSMVVLESMALGKSIIGSRIGGIPEQIEDGETGFLFEMGKENEMGEKMTALINNSELRNKMGRAARKKLEDEYSFESHCQKLLNIYTRLMHN